VHATQGQDAGPLPLSWMPGEVRNAVHVKEAGNRGQLHTAHACPEWKLLKVGATMRQMARIVERF
jgi:hypothetical protein